MNFDKLRYFYIVARNSSLQKGAEELSMAPEKLEAIISEFEREIRNILFNRHQGMWTLTLQGQFLFRKARAILSEVESARSVLEENDKDEISGTLRVMTTNSLASLWIAQHLKDFISKYPSVNFAIYPQDGEVDLSLGESDVCIRPLAPDGQNLIQHYIMTWHVGLYASPEYIKQFGMPKNIRDLDNHRILSLGYESNVAPYKDTNWNLTVGRRPDEMPREPYMRIQSLPAIIDCTLNGIGIAALSKELPIIHQKRLVRVLPEVDGPEVDIFYIYPKFMANSRKVLTFRDHLISRVRQEHEMHKKFLVH
ncbi:MAG: LysR family transcriptional regulator [Holosporaceae bacterium]|nr:MAG: LysR family transcriptional regulator [Holosporaceae bacterium]